MAPKRLVEAGVTEVVEMGLGFVNEEVVEVGVDVVPALKGSAKEEE